MALFTPFLDIFFSTCLFILLSRTGSSLGFCPNRKLTKLACHNFMDVGRKHETSGLKFRK